MIKIQQKARLPNKFDLINFTCYIVFMGGINKMKKKVIEYSLVIVAFIILINLFTSNLVEIQEAAHYVEVDRVIILHFISSLYIIMIGLLLERHTIITLISTRKITITPKFFGGLLLIVIGMLHATFYIKIGVYSLYQPFPMGGLSLNVLLDPLYQGSSVQHILTLLGSIILVRGLASKTMINNR